MTALKSASLTLLTKDRLPLPRYIFQRLQTTTANINVTPHQKPGESVLIHTQSFLSLTVEGIITYCNHERHKKVKKVNISLSSRKQQAANDGQSAAIAKSGVSSELDMASMVKVVNEYFSAEFLLSFPDPGLHTVSILCYMIDANDIQWDIGCTAEVCVKSFRDKKHSSYMKSTT